MEQAIKTAVEQAIASLHLAALLPGLAVAVFLVLLHSTRAHGHAQKGGQR